MSQKAYIKHFFVPTLILFAACSNVVSGNNAPTSSGPEETLYMEWDGQKFILDNGESFQMNERHLIRDEYPDAKTINLTLVKSGLAGSLPDVRAQFKAIGFPDVITVYSPVLFRDKQTKSSVANQPRPLDVYLTDVITISDKDYDYNEMDNFIDQIMDNFIDQIVLFDPRLFTVVLNVRNPSNPNLTRVVDEIEDLGFKTLITLNIAE